MRRRTLFTGLAAAGAATTAAAVFGPSAFADAPNYTVAVTEQVSNKVLFFGRNTAWNNAHLTRSFHPGSGGGWTNLSDVKFRNTKRYNHIGLFTCSGGRVGVWNLSSEKHQEANDILWWAAPGGNPHAIERVPDNGSVIAASSKGFLTVYGPKSSVMNTLAKVQTIDFAGAHGVLWDHVNKLLWAVGDKQLRSYKVTGSGRGTRLKESGKRIALSGLGHDLQPDYRDRGKLLITDTHGVYEVTKSSRALKKISKTKKVKSYSRHSSGDSLWAIPNWSGSSNWRTDTIGFSGGYKRKRSKAGIYKARLFNVNFH